MRSTYITAAIIAVLLLVWLFSGELAEPPRSPAPSIAESMDQGDARRDDTELTTVRVRLVQAQPHYATVVVRGRTAPERSVTVRAEVSGRVVSLPKDKGDTVAAGEPLCVLAEDDRAQRVAEAREALNQARIEYEGALKLKDRGLQSDTQIAQAQARLASAEANAELARLALAKTTIRAPFPGLVGARPVELGDVLQPGAACATVLDPDPLLVVGQVAEQDIVRLAPGMPVTARLLTGGTLDGNITYVAPAPDAATRTWEIEASVPNPDFALRPGLSADVAVAANREMAHLVSPALLALDDAGAIGLRTLDDDDRVVWHPVQIINDQGDGRIWVSGLPELVRLITVGQELVVPGEQVAVQADGNPDLPVATPATDAADKPQATAAAGVPPAAA